MSIDVDRLLARRNPPLLTRKEACAYLFQRHGLWREVATLAKEKCLGEGPDCEVRGRTPMHRAAALDDYAARYFAKERPSVANRKQKVDA